MKFITDKINWTDAMKEFAEKTVEAKLGRIADGLDATEIKLTKLNNDNVKITLTYSKFRSQAVSTDFYAALVEAATTLKNIITKYSKKYDKADRLKESISAVAEAQIVEEDLEEKEEIPYVISKEKAFRLKPMTVEEAIKEFERTDYSFYTFKDICYGAGITIIYKRFNGSYGLIRCN